MGDTAWSISPVISVRLPKKHRNYQFSLIQYEVYATNFVNTNSSLVRFILLKSWARNRILVCPFFTMPPLTVKTSASTSKDNYQDLSPTIFLLFNQLPLEIQILIFQYATSPTEYGYIEPSNLDQYLDQIPQQLYHPWVPRNAFTLYVELFFTCAHRLKTMYRHMYEFGRYR